MGGLTVNQSVFTVSAEKVSLELPAADPDVIKYCDPIFQPTFRGLFDGPLIVPSTHLVHKRQQQGKCRYRVCININGAVMGGLLVVEEACKIV